MSGLAFAYPAVLAALVVLPAIWWLLRLTPPKPVVEAFPPFRILASILKREETPARSPWWLTLLRMLMAAAVILAIADPVLNPRENTLVASGPLVLVIDNSWAAAGDWQRRVDTANAMIDDAEARDLPISVVFTVDRQHDAVPTDAATARTRLAAAQPRPLPAHREQAVAALRTALAGTPPGTLAFLSDGIAGSDDDGTVPALQDLQPAQLRLVEGDGRSTVALTDANNDAETMDVTASRLAAGEARTLALTAHDTRGRAIANGTLTFAAGEATGTGSIAAPFELRNDFAQVTIDGLATAGGTYMLDDGFRRRRVALLTGETHDASQPLLSSLHYIEQALAPFSDLVRPNVADLAAGIPELLEQRPSVMIMADVGRLPEETYAPLQRWLEAGGMLIRFAGPRLAAAPADDPLVPVVLRKGERALDGALSWSEPQPLADYPPTSPFAGMPRAGDVLVKRQVLAEPTPDLPERTWASLADGTPLVTTGKVGAGRIVLFHVSAETGWSNLPLSGDFVEMLRRSVQLSRGGGVAANGETQGQHLPPFRLLTATGTLSTDTGEAKPLDPAAAGTVPATADNPPGLYGSQDGFLAHNLFPAGTSLAPLPSTDAPAVARESLIGQVAQSLKPALFLIAALLLLADCLIVLIMGGAFARRFRPAVTRGAAALALALGLGLALATLAPAPALADDTRPDDAALLDRMDTTHLAYVVTGEAEVDRVSERGLAGLTEFLTYRTTLEPGAPVPVDISKDELAVFPLLYWPVSASAEMPSPATISRIDAYMRNGGTVLFDTRDQFSSLDSGDTSPNTQRLRDILANLDIPPLEPVPPEHVLTKSFYLLTNFPGRFNGSPLWVEAELDQQQDPNRPARSGDGVTPIMITGNDFAGAWAIDANGMALLPTVPPDEVQREHAFRSGVNIMMYMLTGNYKADQVHVPALLERLGQ
ncbi:DUF4159 domain-containing protein [Rhizobium sp. TRM96647]|uniref:DUF4159 domain-containing protein n=1 Tax=unclassified Rhizobium TaxID=2613769 RepID=UPI0021E9A504|nr:MULTISPECIES: DUF4159 domain-containing protein [unclassified Rhizobium]MCV3738075.1 DUF4159 domain-containing protein [Rhizobium sp. TRM96647]MCV3759762.1 DUF4159 domain-containing protein [Rhizobium sp. TRM96650]